MTISEYIYCTDKQERKDYEDHVFLNVWWAFTAQLPKEEDWANNSVDVWYYEDADEILCRTEELAEMVADILEAISGESIAQTGYYDPEEDANDDCVDGRTGWYYVNFD